LESSEPEAKTKFIGRGLTFFRAQPVVFQMELVAIAARLFHAPEIDNEQKFWVKVPGRFQAQQLLSVFKTDEFWLYYEVGTDDDDRRCLFVHDGGFF
jgi:hypothetical protein